MPALPTFSHHSVHPARPLAAALLGLALLAPTVTPGMAQNATPDAAPGGLAALAVDPETATALVTLGTVLREGCGRGRRDACELNAELGRLSDILVAARAACARGQERGCAVSERASERVMALYRRLGDRAR